jgi:hemoglobin-like flavoprotein
VTQGVLLFRHIFRIAPQTKEMFSFKDISDDDLYESKQLKKHGVNVFKYIEEAVDGWGTPEVAEKLQKLGARHLPRDVRIEHFDVVGEALLTSLSDVFGDDFDEKSRDVWTRVYGVIV